MTARLSQIYCASCGGTFARTEAYAVDQCPPCRLSAAILNEISSDAKVIDIGCGYGHYHELLRSRTKELVLLDAHLPYLLRKAEAGFKTVHSEALAWLSTQPPKTFDVAMAIDVPEHLKPEDARLLESFTRRVAKKVILFVPEGEHPQDKDVSGLGGDYWQTHKSIWRWHDRGGTLMYVGHLTVSPYSSPNELSFAAGAAYRIERWRDFHLEKNPQAPDALFCVWEERLWERE